MARHIRVVSPDDLANFAAGGSLDFESRPWEEDSNLRICLSTESFLSGLVVLVATLLILMAVLAVYCIRTRKEPLPLNTASYELTVT